MATEKRREQWRAFHHRKQEVMTPEELEQARLAKAEYDREYRLRRADRRRELRKAYQAKWNEMRRAKTAEYRAEHPKGPPQSKEERALKLREYIEKDRERWLAYHREYYASHAEKLRAYAVEKYKEDPSGWMARNNKRTSERRKTDIVFRVQLNLMKSFHRYLTGATRKVGRWRDLTGCTLAELKLHLESQFKDGMSWGNYGLKGWHVDHIIPMSSFDLTKPEEQARALHYTNLQPMWAIENIRKSNRVEKVGDLGEGCGVGLVLDT